MFLEAFCTSAHPSLAHRPSGAGGRECSGSRLPTHCLRSCRPSFHTSGLFSRVTDSTGPLDTEGVRGWGSVWDLPRSLPQACLAA